MDCLIGFTLYLNCIFMSAYRQCFFVLFFFIVSEINDPEGKQTFLLEDK